MSTASFAGNILYKGVIGSTVGSRMSLDGSVPYSLSCSGDIYISSSANSSSASVVSSLIGSPGGYAVTNGSIPAAVLSTLTKQCGINLRDIWFDVSSTSRGERFQITIAVCDPASFPDQTSEHTFLYEGVIHGDGSNHIRVPDISGLIVSSGLNVVLRLTFGGFDSGDKGYISYHCVADIDD